MSKASTIAAQTQRIEELENKLRSAEDHQAGRNLKHRYQVAAIRREEMKNWEFVDGDEITIAPGRVVKRIRSLVAITSLNVLPGNLGGYVEAEHNLSDDAWVSGNAKVSGNARVSGNAKVSGNARVFGNARVSDNAKVSGNAKVSDDAWVSGNAWVYGDAKVAGNAKVSGNAWVYGGAWVSGNTWVYGGAWVSGNAKVAGNAWVSGNARVYGDAKVSGNARVKERHHIFWASRVGTEGGTLTVMRGKDGLIVTRGCFVGTEQEFLTASKHKHDEKVRRECELLIEVAKSRICG